MCATWGARDLVYSPGSQEAAECWAHLAGLQLRPHWVMKCKSYCESPQLNILSGRKSTDVKTGIHAGTFRKVLISCFTSKITREQVLQVQVSCLKLSLRHQLAIFQLLRRPRRPISAVFASHGACCITLCSHRTSVCFSLLGHDEFLDGLDDLDV